MSHGDQDVPSGTSNTSIAASGCSAMGLMDRTPPSAPNRRGMGNWGMPCTTPAASSIPPAELTWGYGRDSGGRWGTREGCFSRGEDPVPQ